MFPPRTQGTLQNMLRWFAQGKFEKLLWENLFVVLVLGSVISSRGCVVITGYRGYSSGLKQSGSRQHRPTICPYRDYQANIRVLQLWYWCTSINTLFKKRHSQLSNWWHAPTSSLSLVDKIRVCLLLADTVCYLFYSPTSPGQLLQYTGHAQ